jgi:hypothetical protein
MTINEQQADIISTCPMLAVSLVSPSRVCQELMSIQLGPIEH